MLLQEDLWAMYSDVDSFGFINNYDTKVWDGRKLKPYPNRDDKDLEESLRLLDSEMAKLRESYSDEMRIKNPRSREMYTWLRDVVGDQGEKMVPQLNRVFGFEITDAEDEVVPFTFDFKTGKGEFYLGTHEERDYLKD